MDELTPVTPDPITVTLGEDLGQVAVAVVRILSPSGWHQSGCGRDPVAMRAASNSMSSTPSTPSTCTLFGP